jgi:hypothetical protein
MSVLTARESSGYGQLHRPGTQSWMVSSTNTTNAKTVTIARSKLHSMNRLNIAAFTNIKADFDIGWILL